MSARRLLQLMLLGGALTCLGFVGYGVTHRLYNTAAEGAQDFVTDFDTGGLELWRELGEIQACCDDSFVVVSQPSRHGKRALRVTLRANDPEVKASRRAELRMKAGLPGQTHWHAFSVLVPGGWSETLPVTVAQWHGVPDKLLLEAGRSPPLRLLIEDGEWQIANIWDSKRVSRLPFGKLDPDGWDLQSAGTIEADTWVDWVFHINWSYRYDGLLEVWKNGELVYQRSGPNTFNDMLAPYLKLGLYIPGWAAGDASLMNASQTIFIDSIAVSIQPSSYNEIAAKANPT